MKNELDIENKYKGKKDDYLTYAIYGQGGQFLVDTQGEIEHCIEQGINLLDWTELAKNIVEHIVVSPGGDIYFYNTFEDEILMFIKQ